MTNSVFSPYLRREKVEPNTAKRRAERGIWEYDSWITMSRGGDCLSCGCIDMPLNTLGICESCNFKEKMQSLTIIAAPAALQEVRRQYGIEGESDRADRERKVRRAEAEGETW